MVSRARWRLRAALEWIGLPLLYAGLALARLYRPGFHRTSRHLYAAADRLGVYPVIDHYHDPPVRPTTTDRRPRRLPGIDLRVEEQLALLERLRYGNELDAIPRRSDSPTAAYYDNPSFAPADSQIYHSLLRQFRPRRVVEVGGGQSTRFAAQALALNAADGNPGELVAIEPYEAPELEQLGATVVRRRVEDLGAEFFGNLESGDVLFVDSSHVPRAGGDVTFLLLDVLPTLRAGVLVHVHDVFTPRDYPAEWSRRRWFWSEQYVVEGLLTDNRRLEIELAVSFLLERYPREFAAACPVPAVDAPGPTPASLWLRTVG